MRIESRKMEGASTNRRPRKRVDAQAIPGAVHFGLMGPGPSATLRVIADVHAGPSQDPRAMSIQFGETETATLRALMVGNLGRTDSQELKQLRELRDDVQAYVSDYRHGLGPSLVRLVRALVACGALPATALEGL
jgi:hypothetical protein